ncbi:metallopeptidase TldD-related protein [uncultured Streptomyces sp.]|uniref:metallopeptidase TldD-related protein n=1 Tax=uncultured Streptomyces sp. TaxID=174707 RepID=UPI0026074B13|nr:metallopeptidase TldD-related protein [uncultured Streptomyces sp.]
MSDALAEALAETRQALGPTARVSWGEGDDGLVRVHVTLGPARHGHTPQWGVAAYDRGFVLAELRRGVSQLQTDRALLAGRAPLTRPLSGAALLSPAAAGVFVHECFGHTSEADNYLARETSADRVLGDRWTTAPVTVRDLPRARPYAGSYDEDDEGTPSRTVTLLTEGRWTGLLTHRATRRLSGGQSTGHGRGAAGTAVPRCSVLEVEPGPYSSPELLRQMGDGWLLGTPVGGYSVNGLLVLELLWIRRARAGRLTDEVLGPAVVCAKKSALAAQVTAIGSDTVVHSSPYTCVKESYEVGSTLISPSLLLKRCVLRPLDQFGRGRRKD